VLVIGGGSVGAETAHYMAAQGKKVIIIEMLPEIVPQMIVDFRYHLLTRLSELGVEVMCNTTVCEIRKDTVRLNTPKGEQILKEIETVVVATGGKPNNSLEQELNKMPLEVRVIGDAQKPEDGVKAVYDGYMAGYEM
jgi:pyruvate/2-oxoglutarate dehydrogenase complex dihydrolipoamide dehydrogenase (E3) component